MMRVIPVLDLLNGVAVRGVAGERHRYRPVNSLLTPSRDPSVLMRVLQETFALSTFYVADLDAIEGREPNRCVLAELTRSTASLMVDGGVRCEQDVRDLLDLGVDQVVVGLETLPDATTAKNIASAFSPEEVVLSLDLKSGRPLTTHPDWSALSATELAGYFFGLGYRNMIVLDLASVGTGQGIPALDLCRQLRTELDLGELITGGGVSRSADLHHAKNSGVDAVLVASALHDGRITPTDLTTQKPAVRRDPPGRPDA